MIGELNKTPLHDRHAGRGAKLVNFGGWEMPLWYPTGAVREHLAVITHAGLFDTGHMAAITVAGPQSRDLLQLCFSKDLGRIAPGRCSYGVFLEPAGGVIDDAIVYAAGPADFLVVVNAGMGPVVADHLDYHRGRLDARISDLTGVLGKMDLQGPETGRVISRILEEPETVLSGMPYFSFKGHVDPDRRRAGVRLIDGTQVLLSRTGYTGEYGFEIFIPAEASVRVWDMILEAGGGRVTPCGLAARDSLRTGAVLPLSHQDIGPWPFINHPWTFALPFTSDGLSFTKSFIGDAVLKKRAAADHTLAFVGFDPRKVAIHDPGFGPARVEADTGEDIGNVLTCVADMALGWHDDRIYSLASPNRPAGLIPKGLCCGFVKVKSGLPAGTIVHLKDKRRRIEAMIVDDVRPHRTARLAPGRLP